jgi:hypothetical protein
MIGSPMLSAALYLSNMIIEAHVVEIAKNRRGSTLAHATTRGSFPREALLAPSSLKPTSKYGC